MIRFEFCLGLGCFKAAQPEVEFGLFLAEDAAVVLQSALAERLVVDRVLRLEAGRLIELRLGCGHHLSGVANVDIAARTDAGLLEMSSRNGVLQPDERCPLRYHVPHLDDNLLQHPVPLRGQQGAVDHVDVALGDIQQATIVLRRRRVVTHSDAAENEESEKQASPVTDSHDSHPHVREEFRAFALSPRIPRRTRLV